MPMTRTEYRLAIALHIARLALIRIGAESTDAHIRDICKREQVRMDEVLHETDEPC